MSHDRPDPAEAQGPPSLAAARCVRAAVLEALRLRHRWSPSRNSLSLSWRTWRWLIQLPGYVGFVAPDDAAWRRLHREAALLQAMHPAVGDVLPQVELDDPTLRMQLRRWVSGTSGHGVERLVFGRDTLPSSQSRYLDQCPLTAGGERLAEDLGCTLALLHHAIPLGQARRLGLVEHSREPALARAAEVLAEHVDDQPLRAALERGRRWYADFQGEPVPLHGDPHMHNLLVDPTTGALRALIDLEDCCLGPREDDLRYLCSNGVPFARRVLFAYRRTARVELDEAVVWRFHALSAFEHLAWVPVGAERFAHIIRWARAAVEGLARDWAG